MQQYATSNKAPASLHLPDSAVVLLSCPHITIKVYILIDLVMNSELYFHVS